MTIQKMKTMTQRRMRLSRSKTKSTTCLLQMKLNVKAMSIAKKKDTNFWVVDVIGQRKQRMGVTCKAKEKSDCQ
ncbi:hypothetical protein AHAS_Ahas03G0115300 [Arachis hypogaea]